jgi:UDP-N-acetylmuramyl pentapeptide phosphotransferase/UDP-N-acetylglucosamine-1-phosphate transferase
VERYIIAFLAALTVSFITTPFIKKLALKIGAIDVPKDDRRVHDKPIPRLGGLAIYIAFIAVILALVPYSPKPIFDTTFAIIRRAVNGKPIMEADRGHLHHRLLALGLSQRQVVFTLYAVSAFLGLGAIVITQDNPVKSIAVVGFVVATMVLVMTQMGFQEPEL